MEQRKIIFKAKRLDNCEWVKGYYFEVCGNTYIIEDRQEKSMLNRNHPYQVDPSTVCQFTGLKDSKGVDIYEGDLVDYESTGEVIYQRGAFYVKFSKYAECLLGNLLESKITEFRVKVIGSKFDRKEEK